MKTKQFPSMWDFSISPHFSKANLAVDALAVFLGSLFLILGAQVSIPLPFTPVPITGQTFSVLVIGSMLGVSRAPLAVLLYIAYGALGLPVFADHSGGVHVVMGATGGYIIGFIFSAMLIGYLSEKGWDRTYGKSILAMTLGHLLIFAFGLAWLVPFVGADQVLAKGFYPFILGTIVKTLLAGSTSAVGWIFLKKFFKKSGA
jgi:biotin transport system substrate-specific component